MRFIFPSLFGFLFACLFSVAAQATGSKGEIAITIDDLPYVTPSKTSPETGLAQVKSVNAALKAHGITATGFVIGGQIDRHSRAAVQAFADAGHMIGNHTWTHADYGTQTEAQFRRELRRTDRRLRSWMPGAKFFRFPYLREGESAEDKAKAADILIEFGYVNAPVSIDNDDWRYNADYVTALADADTERAKEVSDAYLAHIKSQTATYQARAKEAIGRDVKHILLLHMNQINADHLPALLDWYASQGWRFISLENAMSDPMYQAPDRYAGPKGLSKIDRLLHSAAAMQTQ